MSAAAEHRANMRGETWEADGAKTLPLYIRSKTAPNGTNPCKRRMSAKARGAG